jgi:ribonuclease BN (tRNA processing enzyme)
MLKKSADENRPASYYTNDLDRRAALEFEEGADEDLMRLTILGCGDAFSGGGRLPSCYLVETGETTFLLDCGPSILPALKRMGRTTNDFDTIVISHLHGDHFGGLPFLLIDAIYLARRNTPLTLIGPPGLEARFRLACEVLYPRVLDTQRPFPIRFIELAPGVPRRLDALPGIELTPYEVSHYSGSPSFALRFVMEDKVFAFSGDAGWGENVVKAGQDADVYLLECYQYDFKLDVHLDYVTIAQNFDVIGAKRYVLTHMGDAMLASSHKVDINRCTLAEDGLAMDF